MDIVDDTGSKGFHRSIEQLQRCADLVFFGSDCESLLEHQQPCGGRTGYAMRTLRRNMAPERILKYVRTGACFK